MLYKEDVRVHRRDKEALVSELQNRFKESEVAILTDFTGLNVEQITKLRWQLREAGVEYKVVKNTLLRLAAQDTDMSLLAEHFSGPNAVALSSDDPVAPAKVMAEFSHEYPALEIKAGIVRGQVLAKEQIKTLASLPSKEVLLSKLVAVLKAVPTRFVRVLNNPVQRIVWLLDAVGQTRQGEETQPEDSRQPKKG